MTLWDMFSLVRYITNKDFSGNVVTPERFNELIKVVNIDLFRKKYGLPEEFQPGQPIASESVDITLKNTDDLKAFKVASLNATVSAGVLSIPIGYFHRDSITYNYSVPINGVATILPRPVEILKEEAFSSRNGNFTKRPTTQNPIGVVRSNGIHIRPLAVLLVDFHYFRYPLDPVFAYTLGDGFVTYDAVNSVETEWVRDEHLTLVRMMLSLVGVNLREETVLNYAETKLKEG